jgi:hypothetical protein
MKRLSKPYRLSVNRTRFVVVLTSCIGLTLALSAASVPAQLTADSLALKCFSRQDPANQANNLVSCTATDNEAGEGVCWIKIFDAAGNLLAPRYNFSCPATATTTPEISLPKNTPYQAKARDCTAKPKDAAYRTWSGKA